MRPLFHPSIEDVTVEAILHALSDPVRVAIFSQIANSECSQHFTALRHAGLIRGERRGVEMRNTSRCAEIERRFPGLIKAIIHAHKVQCGAQRKKKPWPSGSRSRSAPR